MAVREDVGMFDVSHMGQIETSVRSQWSCCSG